MQYNLLYVASKQMLKTISAGIMYVYIILEEKPEKMLIKLKTVISAEGCGVRNTYIDMYTRACVCGVCIHGFNTDGKYIF